MKNTSDLGTTKKPAAVAETQPAPPAATSTPVEAASASSSPATPPAAARAELPAKRGPIPGKAPPRELAKPETPRELTPAEIMAAKVRTAQRESAATSDEELTLWTDTFSSAVKNGKSDAEGLTLAHEALATKRHEDAAKEAKNSDASSPRGASENRKIEAPATTPTQAHASHATPKKK